MKTAHAHESDHSIEVASSVGIRELTASFGHISDFQRFFEAMQGGLERVALIPGTRLRFTPAARDALAEGAGYKMGVLNVPVVGRHETHGRISLAMSGHRRMLGPEDLHLMTSLAGFVAAWVDHASHYGDILANSELMRFVLDMAPVGLLAIDSDNRLCVMNQKAREWLGDLSEVDLGKILPEDGQGHDSRRYLRHAGKLLYSETVAAPARIDGRVSRAVAIVDLTAEQTALIDGLARELYRANWLGKKSSFLLLDSSAPLGRFLRSMPAIRAVLAPMDICGPYDCSRIAIMLVGRDRPEATRFLRRIRAILGNEAPRAGVVETGPDIADIESLLDRALSGMGAVDEIVRPRILLHDDHPVVNDMLERIIGREFTFVKSSSLEDTRRMLRAFPFDGFVTELDLNEGCTGLELARMAVELQPGLRPFFTTCAGHARMMEDDPLLKAAAVFPKPFIVCDVARAIEGALKPG